jgi:hypothetical protein
MGMPIDDGQIVPERKDDVIVPDDDEMVPEGKDAYVEE